MLYRMSKNPIEQNIAEALGVEWDGKIYQDDPPKNTEVYDENGKDMSAFWYGRKMPYTPRPEGFQLGRKHSDETKQRMSEAAKARPPREWVPSFKGRKHSDETKEKMRKSAYARAK